MLIKTADFHLSVAARRGLEAIDDKPQVAFVGRSNVGKSSLINMLLQRKKLVKTSGTPGHTKLINFFTVNTEYYFVDLPGYGFAKAGKKKVASWEDVIEVYFKQTQNLKCVFVLLDIRHTPNDDDCTMINFLQTYAIPFCCIATKADKLSKSAVGVAVSKMASKLGLTVNNIFATSADSRLNREKVLDYIEQKLTDS